MYKIVIILAIVLQAFALALLLSVQRGVFLERELHRIKQEQRMIYAPAPKSFVILI